MESACGLAAEIIRTFGEVRLRVFGTSMAPAVLPGDLVSIQRAALDETFPGEIVAFLRDGRLFVHRVIGRKAAGCADVASGSLLITLGDRLRQDDPAVSPAEFLGRVVSLERGNVAIEMPVHKSHRLIAGLLRSSDLATYLYLRLAAAFPALLFRRAQCQMYRPHLRWSVRA
jgi:hypothetical protein